MPVTEELLEAVLLEKGCQKPGGSAWDWWGPEDVQYWANKNPVLASREECLASAVRRLLCQVEDLRREVEALQEREKED